MNVALWIAQILLGGMFVMAGSFKAFNHAGAIAALPWAADVSVGLLTFIGISELLGGLGLIVPSVARIKPGLTPLAGAGLALVMVLASVFHATRGEYGAIGINLVLGAVAVFLAYGRWRKAPIEAR